MIEEAQKSGNKAAERSFSMANTVEKTHARLYKDALENLGNNIAADIYVCPVCGETIVGNVPEQCPVCKASGKMFIKID